MITKNDIIRVIKYMISKNPQLLTLKVVLKIVENTSEEDINKHLDELKSTEVRGKTAKRLKR